MVSVDKFYVYGDGRWREVDTGSGRIDGWGRAKFLVNRGGKLEAARSRPVLAALRALADRKPSAAKEGPQIPYRYPRLKSRERGPQGCEHQCCHHSNSGSGCTSKSDNKASVAIQCNNADLSTTHKKTDNPTTTTGITTQNSTTNKKTIILTRNVEKTDKSREKRKRVSTSSEDLFHTKVVTVATVHSPRKPEAKRRRISSNTRLARNDSTSSDDDRPITKPAKKSPRLQLRRSRPLKRKQSSSGESIILESKSDRKIRKKDGSLPRRSARHNVSLVISDDSDFEDSSHRQRSNSEEPLKAGLKGPKRTERSNETKKVGPKENSSTNELIKARLGPKRNLVSLNDEQIKNNIGEDNTDRSSTDESQPLRGKQTESTKNEPNRHISKKTSEISDNEPIKSLISPKRTLKSSKDKLKHKGPKDDEKFNSQVLDMSSGTINKEHITNTQESSKELLIDESDVEILRLFLQKHYPDEDLLRFDTDDDYKRMHFYRINPLIYVERCPRIARMILDSHNNKLSLVDFASKLGLRSVSEKSSVKRYRTRRRDEKKSYREDIEDKENERPSKTSNIHRAKAVGRKEREDKSREKENTKDNVELSSDSEKVNERPSKSNKLHKAKAMGRKERKDKSRERENTKENVELSSDSEKTVNERASKSNKLHKAKAVRTKEREDKSRERDITKDTVELSSDSEKVDERPSKSNKLHKVKAVRRKERVVNGKERDNTKDTVELSTGNGKEVKVLKKIKPKAVSKRPPLNEYSNLEDHAIVTWVSVGGRACSVNGNRIWRELQDQFHRITGHERTWHSLRNRYLRYILPRLGALALPPALQTRLRAAAATGELKAKRRGATRNSIFKPPTRGAFSRRPARLESDQESVREKENGDEEDEAPHSPRYSDVTRQFARKHRYSSERSHESHKSRRASDKLNNSENKSKNSTPSAKSNKNSGKSRSETSDKSRSRSEKSRNSPNAKSRYNTHISREKISDKSSDSTSDKSRNTPQNKRGIQRKQSLSPQRRNRSPSDSSHETDGRNSRNKSSDSYSSDSDSSEPSESPRRKSDRLRTPSGSPVRRKSRINSSESNRRKSSRINSPESNSRKSNRINSPEPNRRKSNRINSPEPNRRKSNRINSPESNRRKSNRINSPESHRINSPESNRRKSNRINSPESNKRMSSRNKSPLDRQNFRDSSIDSSDSSPILNRRKSNRINSPETRRRSNRVRSPIKVNRSDSRDKSNKQSIIESLSESRKQINSPERNNSQQRRSNRFKVETANEASSQEKLVRSHDRKLQNDRRENSKSLKPRTRKLFNPREML